MMIDSPSWCYNLVFVSPRAPAPGSLAFHHSQSIWLVTQCCHHYTLTLMFILSKNIWHWHIFQWTLELYNLSQAIQWHTRLGLELVFGGFKLNFWARGSVKLHPINHHSVFTRDWNLELFLPCFSYAVLTTDWAKKLEKFSSISLLASSMAACFLDFSSSSNKHLSSFCFRPWQHSWMPNNQTCLPGQVSLWRGVSHLHISLW